MKIDHDPAFSDDHRPWRLLRAIESIARLGPTTYEQLRADLGISKTAVWRMVATLRDCGWVRVSHGGGIVQLDARLDDLFATSQYADREFSPIFEAMCDISKSRSVHIDLFTMDTDAEPALVDTTRRVSVSAVGSDDSDENVIAVLQTMMTPVQLTRHLNKILETADAEQSVDIRSGNFVRRLRKLNGLVWAKDETALCLGLRGKMGTPAALRISPRSSTADRATLACACTELKTRLNGLVEVFGTSNVELR